MFSRMKTSESTRDYSDKINLIAEKIREADAVIIGAGAGLSTSAGFTYSGERFAKYFSDMEEKYGFHDMYSGSFYDYDCLEEMWAFWSRDIFINRYMDAPKSVYSDIFELVKDKNYFVLTTNVDHCFQKAGFDKRRLFYTQGDYGLFQCSEPCHEETYDNEKMIMNMLIGQGYEICDDELIVPKGVMLKTEIDSNLVPRCPKCGRPMSMNLRSDSTFVQDEGWEEASDKYSEFLVTRYRLSPDVVDLIAFCTKNPAPMLSQMDDFIRLSNVVGVDSVGWRYDPIFVDEKHSVEWHISEFEYMAMKLAGFTRTCVISFMDIYKKVERNFPQAREVSKKDRITIGKILIW